MPGKNIEFDQVVGGNIDIKQLSKNKYKITFSEINNFLVYLVMINDLGYSTYISF